MKNKEQTKKNKDEKGKILKKNSILSNLHCNSCFHLKVKTKKKVKKMQEKR